MAPGPEKSRHLFAPRLKFCFWSPHWRAPRVRPPRSMMQGETSTSPLAEFLLLAKSAKGAACAQLVLQVLEHPSIHVFGELLDMPNVREVRDSSFPTWDPSLVVSIKRARALDRDDTRLHTSPARPHLQSTQTHRSLSQRMPSDPHITASPPPIHRSSRQRKPTDFHLTPSLAAHSRLPSHPPPAHLPRSSLHRDPQTCWSSSRYLRTAPGRTTRVRHS